VFSTINDLSRFCAAILAGGRRNDKQVLNDQWINKSLTNYTSGKNEDRGLAWEMLKDENYHAPFGGHTGFTGTSIWINPELDAFAILLTNRVHPNRDDQVTIKYLRNAIRRKCWDIVQNQNDKLT
jgi:CubicO group peptidase (beta-lactamase class C family)